MAEHDDIVPEMATGGGLRSSGTPSRPSRQSSLTMERFLETRNLDDVTADMLKQYDQDGDGKFSKDEVVSILLDLRQKQDENQALRVANALFRKMLIGSFIMCTLLLAGMFGLSFAVAALTAKMDVTDSGRLVATDSESSFVATDNAANVYGADRDPVEGVYCIPQSEGELIIDQVLEGRNVLVQLDDYDENGHAVVEQLAASGADIDPSTGVVCFPAPGMGNSTQKVCLRPNDERCTNAVRRRLKEACRGDDCEDAEIEGMFIET